MGHARPLFVYFYFLLNSTTHLIQNVAINGKVKMVCLAFEPKTV